MQDTKPALALERSPAGERVVLRGDWSVRALAMHPHWQVDLQALQAAHAVHWDLRAVERLDHTGAQLLWNAWGRQWPAQVELQSDQRAILQRVERFSAPPPTPQARTLRAWVVQLGAGFWVLQSHVAQGVRLIGQLVLDVLHLVRAPRGAPWRDISGHLYRIGVTALPITALVGFLIGVVLAYLMARQMRQFGADAFIVNVLGMALVRELGPVLAAILIAGRSGSAITAQIGVMRVNEELDAMRVMGIPTGYRLVLPRVLALALGMPLLAVWTTAAALLGGMLAANLTLGLTPAYFLSALPKAVQLSNLWLALGKSVVFGGVIALVGCHYGLRVLPNTQSLGEGTTASVVVSITLVLLLDAAAAVLFKGVGL